jgi:hypothetical protein
VRACFTVVTTEGTALDRVMSALPLKADIDWRLAYVR